MILNDYFLITNLSDLIMKRLVMAGRGVHVIKQPPRGMVVAGHGVHHLVPLHPMVGQHGHVLAGECLPRGRVLEGIAVGVCQGGPPPVGQEGPGGRGGQARRGRLIRGHLGGAVW